MEPTLNSYRIVSYTALRRVLSTWRLLQAEAEAGDYTAASMLVDFQNAFDETMTDRQREAVDLLLLQDLSIHEVTKQMDIQWRVAYALAQTGVTALLVYLQNGTRPVWWKKWELDFLRNNDTMSRVEIGKVIGRSTSAVYRQIHSLRRNGEIIRTVERSGSSARSRRQQRAETGVPDSQ